MDEVEVTDEVTADEVHLWFRASIRRRACPTPEQCKPLATLINTLRLDRTPETITRNRAEVELLAMGAAQAQALLTTMQEIYSPLPEAATP
jgi:hypothetical protein